MALVRAERVLETSTTTGTGSLTLGGPVTGYRSFASVMATNDTCYYAIVAVDSSGRPTGAWETGLGTLTGATTFTRTTVLASSNGGALVTLAAGTKQVFLTLSATEIIDIATSLASKASATQMDVYTSSDTWTKPDGAKFVDVIVVGGGGGGNSGALRSSSIINENTGTNGGNPGAPGGVVAVYGIPATKLTGTVSVTVGTGGTGAASRTTTSNGAAGTAGGSSSFGSYVTRASITGTGIGGNGSESGTGTVAAPGTAGNAGIFPISGFFSNTTVSMSYSGLNVGGSGGSAGAAGQATAATATGGNGGNGIDLTGDDRYQLSSSGGGGGGAQVRSAGATNAAIGGDGGNGGFPGGGGGGGGGAFAERSTLPTGSKSGKGGNGASGIVVVVTHF